jgi:hypothetical protein
MLLLDPFNTQPLSTCTPTSETLVPANVGKASLACQSVASANDLPGSVRGDLCAMREPIELREDVDFPLTSGCSNDRGAHESARHVTEDADRVPDLVPEECRRRRACRLASESSRRPGGAIVGIGAIDESRA